MNSSKIFSVKEHIREDFEHLAGIHPLVASFFLFSAVLVFALIVLAMVWSYF